MKTLKSATWILMIAIAGCVASKHPLRRGTPVTTVQFELGKPDAIADESGDEKRFYTPSNRPHDEWPWDAPRTFYYLERDIAVVFVRGRLVRCTVIDVGTRQILDGIMPEQR